MQSSQRLPFLDGLRVAAFALLIPYHVGMYYVSWGWHVKSAQSAAAAPWIEPFMFLTAPWRLGLLFLVAGAACQALWAKRGSWGFLRERSSRLLIPLLFGMAVIVVPQAFFEVQTRAPQLLPGDGGYLDFWRAYLHGGEYCRDHECLKVPTWNHLWFLPYLWVYALLGPLLAKLATRAPLRLSTLAWLWVPALPLVLARLYVFPSFPSTHALVNDLYNHLQYGYLFALGWASRMPIAQGFWAAVEARRKLLLGLSIASWAVLVAYFASGVEWPDAVRNAQRVLWGLFEWLAIAAACGWAQRVFRQPSKVLSWLSGAVFCLYILHQSVIVVLSQWIKPLQLGWGLEALLLIGATAAVCLGSYALLKRVPGLRRVFGISVESQRSKGGRDAGDRAVRTGADALGALPLDPAGSRPGL